MKATLPPELEQAVRTRLKFWGVAAGIAFLLLLLAIAYLMIELRRLKAEAVRVNQPLMIYNQAWGTVIDAVDPDRFPGTHPDDVRKGTLIQQWPVHGGPQHIWELRHPYGPRYQSNAPVLAP